MPPPRYSPRLRTALVLIGTGTAGAYHAGVLRAVQEAGVKIDIVAGRGIGVASAMLTAIDGGSSLWEEGGWWRSGPSVRLYRWRTTLRAGIYALGVALGALLLPIGTLVGGVLVYPLAFLLRLLGFESGDVLASGYARLLDAVFDPTVLPLYLPRFVVLSLVMFLAIMLVGAIGTAVRTRAQRRFRGALLWRLAGAPLNVSRAATFFTEALWQAMRGAARITRPADDDLGKRYSELLAENVGQPGFRELILLVHDLDARRDLVLALLAKQHRQAFFPRWSGTGVGDRYLETLDLAGPSRQHAVDALIASLSIPVATEPRLVSFAPDSRWQGEVHRLCDRPESTTRLLEEVAAAGAEQVILVTSLPEETGPHTLEAGRRDARGRAGEYLMALETASVRDGVVAREGLFQALFQIRPTHNPLGPFDFAGCYDERSDRRQTLAELVDRGYEDGFRQFVDSVVGASGEWIQPPSSEDRRARQTRERGTFEPQSETRSVDASSTSTGEH